MSAVGKIAQGWRFSWLVALLLLAGCLTPGTVNISPTALPSPISAATETPRAMRLFEGTLTIETIDSEALSDNLLGDPSERKVAVYLPSGYEESDRRYPVAYVLHAQFGSELSMPQKLIKPLEKLIAEGEASEMILVFPNIQNGFQCPAYLDSPTLGNYETFLTDELVSWVDVNYRTLPHSESRAIVGCDVGADGALHLGLTHPDVFGVAVGETGTYDYETDPGWDTTLTLLKKLPEDLQGVRSSHWTVGLYLSTAAAAASNPDKPPFYLDMPFAIVDEQAQIVREVKEKIVDNDVVRDLNRSLLQSRELPEIMIYHGAADSYVPIDLSRAFSKLLTDHDIEHTYLEGTGGHCNYGNLDHTPVIEYLADSFAF